MTVALCGGFQPAFDLRSDPDRAIGTPRPTARPARVLATASEGTLVASTPSAARAVSEDTARWRTAHRLLPCHRPHR